MADPTDDVIAIQAEADEIFARLLATLQAQNEDVD